jgi:hypothetical protein
MRLGQRGLEREHAVQRSRGGLVLARVQHHHRLVEAAPHLGGTGVGRVPGQRRAVRCVVGSIAALQRQAAQQHASDCQQRA